MLIKKSSYLIFVRYIYIPAIIAISATSSVLAIVKKDDYETYVKSKLELLKPSVSEYVKTIDTNFIGNKDLKYNIRYTLLKGLGDKPSIRVEFENPAGGDPLIVEKDLEQDENELDISSPALPGIKNGEIYTIKLLLFSDEHLVATHIDHSRFYSNPKLAEIFGFNIYNKPDKEELIKLSSNYFSLFNQNKYEKAVGLFHYPVSFTSQKLKTEKYAISKVLQYLSEEFGEIKNEQLVESRKDYQLVASIQSADDRYWFIHPYAPEILYKVGFGNGEEGIFLVNFCDINGSWEIRSIAYFLPASNPKAQEYAFDFRKEMRKLIKQIESGIE